MRTRLARLAQPAAVLEVLQSTVLPADFGPAAADCKVESVHPDRFTLRVQVRSASGEVRAYALKVYSDDFVERLWKQCRTLTEHYQQHRSGLCLPTRYVPHERMLVFSWEDGERLSEIVDDRKPDLLREAARVAAHLHRLAIVPDQVTTAQMLVDRTQVRCDRLRNRLPETTPMVESLMAILEDAARFLDPAEPAPAHGDLGPGQFLWTGDRLVLLDMDMFGYTDPAYDAGHFLGQLERRLLLDPTLPAHAWHWLACFRDVYLAAMPHVSPRNMAFYRGLTLVQKIYTVCWRQPVEGPKLVAPLAIHARAALREVASLEHAS